MYAPSYGYQQVVFEATGLGAGSHTLLVMNTGHEEPVIDGHVSGHRCGRSGECGGAGGDVAV